MSGFSYAKSISGDASTPANFKLIGANSVVFQIGDLIRVNADGNASLVTAGDLVLGVVTAVTDKNGVRLTPDTGTLDTYTMASDNATVAQKRVHYIPALQEYLFFNTADSALTTANLFQYMNVNDENDVDPASPSDATISTVRLIEIDPRQTGTTGEGLFQIVESFWAQNCMGTVDTGGIEAA